MAIKFRGVAICASPPVRGAPRDWRGVIQSPEFEGIFFPARRTPGVDLAKFYGPAGDGYEYHHIAEQSAEGDIPASDLNSTGNIVRIPKLLHEEINSEYAKTEYGKRTSIREELTGKSCEERQAKGLEVMRDIGIIE